MKESEIANLGTRLAAGVSERAGLLEMHRKINSILSELGLLRLEMAARGLATSRPRRKDIDLSAIGRRLYSRPRADSSAQIVDPKKHRRLAQQAIREMDQAGLDRHFKKAKRSRRRTSR